MVKLNECFILLKMKSYQKNITDKVRINCKVLESYKVLKVSNSIKKETDREPIYNQTFLRTKIKSQGDEAEGFHFVLKKDENYFQQMFSKGCKCIHKYIQK